MSLRRLRDVFRLELSFHARRPLVLMLVALVAFSSWALSDGSMHIASGDTSVGGKKAFITSEFANAQIFSMLIFLFYSFFIAVAAGMSVIRDDELKVGEVIHATPLRPREYVWGKFLAVLAVFCGVLALHLALAMVFNHLVPRSEAEHYLGPWRLVNYLRPVLALGLPDMIFIAGTTFAVGVRTRRPIPVFVLPVAAILLCAFFLWQWAPGWLDPRVNRALGWLDPAGFRWLNETWLKVDRGVDFYNAAPLGFDAPFAASRALLAGAGLAAVALAERRFARGLRGAAGGAARAAAGAGVPAAASPAAVAPSAPLALLGMSARRPSFPATLRAAAAAEFRELRSHAGLYLFIPLILIETIGTGLLAVGPWDTPLLVTSGAYAAGTMNTLSLLLCLLLLFYTVESLGRDRQTGLAPIAHATAARNGAIVCGKALANGLVVAVILGAALLGGVVVQLVQGRGVPLEPAPFLLMWGLLLGPTLLCWSAFVTAAHSLTGNRYGTYGVALGALCLTGFLQLRGKMNWVGNWDLWNAVVWSDMGRFELVSRELALNRILALSLAALFGWIALRGGGRREPDASRVAHRARPGPAARGLLRAAPWLAVPAVAAALLGVGVRDGFQGKLSENRTRDYWKKNLFTWKDAANPSLDHVELDLELDPARRSFHSRGTFRLVNLTAGPLRQFALSGGIAWEEVAWTLNGSPAAPEDRAKLWVFTPAAPLAPGDTALVGFDIRGTHPKGSTRNGGGAGTFILPSGVVLTSFEPSVVPVVGFSEEVEIDRKYRPEPREYPEDFHLGLTPPGFAQGARYTTRIRVSGPPEYRFHSVGTLVSDETAAGRRTMVWQSDFPVRFFNVVAARWAVRSGEGTALYYHPSHDYNVEEMGLALDAARAWYGEWFAPFPWKELKLSEFPGLARYAQGFPTNITFSESIGFLAKSDPRSNIAFAITAHEAAHQWWGNMLLPGKGPGGDILSEGMSHFSTVLLTEQVKGLRSRIEFCRRMEDRYGDERQLDAERSLVRMDGSRPGDVTATYDKGGWVFWMLMQRIGREAMLAGLRSFIAEWRDGPDYPVLADFAEHMRRYAPDPAAYDDFADQWFRQVVVPEYRVREASKRDLGDGRWEVRARVENAGTGRMPVEVAAVKGDRFPGGEAGDAVSPGYRAARDLLILGAGESGDLTLRCDFEPDAVRVDPDALVLQLRRENAVADL